MYPVTVSKDINIVIIDFVFKALYVNYLDYYLLNNNSCHEKYGTVLISANFKLKTLKYFFLFNF